MTFDKVARFALDHERERLRTLDILDGGSRLLNWHLEVLGQEDLEIMAARKANVLPNMELVTALNFVSVAGTKDDAPYKLHVALNNRFAVCCDGQISAGYPISAELECCPHLGQLRAALAKTGESLSIAELGTGQLSVTGDKLTAKIPCLTFDALPDPRLTTPDPVCAAIDDRLKAAFAACGVVVTENGTRAHECGMLLGANECTSTNGKVLLQYWHGIDLPPNLFIPKIFAAAVCKVKLPLSGFGFTAGRSITFYFEGGAWIKTQLYDDKYPDVGSIINQATSPVPVPDNLFDAIETVAGFNADGFAKLVEGKVITDNAAYQVDGLDAACSFNSEFTKMVAPFAKTIDMKTFGDRAFFFGDKVRGVIMGVKVRSASHENESSEVPF